MKILVIDDEDQFAGELISELGEIVGSGNVMRAASRDSAERMIREQFFDLFIVDLKIPPTDDSIDANVSHGEAVFGYCRELAQGTPICFLTGSSTEPFVTRLLNEHSIAADYWGTEAAHAGVKVYRKLDLADLLAHVKQLQSLFEGLQNIEIREATGQSISPDQKRVLKLFTRRMKGVVCEVTQLKGGMSDASVYKLGVFNGAGRCTNQAVGRIGPVNSLADEVRKFDTNVTALGVGAFPTRICFLTHGAKSTGGIFYRLANEHVDCFADFLVKCPEQLGVLSLKMRDLFEPWIDGGYQRRIAISDLRRQLLEDKVLESLMASFPLEWIHAFEKIEVNVVWGKKHGDLHGGNILVSPAGDPLVIDFGDVDDGAIAFDPITLCLSPFFHPQTSESMLGRFNADDVITLLVTPSEHRDKDFSEFFGGCKIWIDQLICQSPRTYFALIYCFCLRQLKYGDTDKNLAQALIDFSKREIDETLT
ncbi:phosphotransferase [Massilia sp. GCM10020059]|uniref:Phosphotransferase n=1 Tax=Massilia agrisoli TaxID=2892444 RepID=A0ABS8IPZ3_9BURK|nr:phosphotransferase [Massilia agrisoli]MCC6070476.1 phosphotransferase [Massilia agrisoli]